MVPQQPVHGALLDLVAGFPAGDRGRRDAEVRGELFLRQSQSFAVVADLLWREEAELDAQRLLDAKGGDALELVSAQKSISA